MGKIVTRNQPCLKCKSSDARQIYEDGSSFCFSCSTPFKSDDTEEEIKIDKPDRAAKLAEIDAYPTRGFKDRQITKDVCEFFGVKVSYDSDGQIDTHYYPYPHGYKVRRLPKDFSFIGSSGGLFGQDKFNGAGKRLIITEGEIDALSVAQAHLDKYQKIYPVVSVPSASGTKELLNSRDWIRSFEEVVLWFDNDTAGEEALAKALRVVGIDKAKIAKSPSGAKDASDVLVKFGWQRLMQVTWDAARWSPANIITKEKLWEELSNRNSVPSVPYPDCLRGLNVKLKGMRAGEIALLISGTGSGKSTITREIGLHVLESTTDKLGVISLEESPGETALKYSGMALNRNPAHEEIPIEELKVGFDKVFGEDRVVLLDHQGSIKDSSIVDQLEYMCLVGCKYLIIDHITILVSEGADGLQGNEAIDKIMNDLLRLVKRHNVWVCLVSHLRKTQVTGKSFEEGRMPSIDDIRGSGSIKQVSFDIIAFARNMTAEDEAERNAIKMSVLKARTTGLTGPVAGAYYVHKTGRLGGLELRPDENFEIL